jgi:hypothetical protein
MNGPHELVFFTDRDLGRRFPSVLRAAGLRIEQLRVLMERGTKLFVLVGKLTSEEAAEMFLKWREQIASTLCNERDPFIAKIRRDGVHIWLCRADWRKSQVLVKS